MLRRGFFYFYGAVSHFYELAFDSLMLMRYCPGMTYADQPHAIVILGHDGRPAVCIPDKDTKPLAPNLAIYPTRDIADSWLGRYRSETAMGGIYFTIPAAVIYDVEEVTVPATTKYTFKNK